MCIAQDEGPVLLLSEGVVLLAHRARFFWPCAFRVARVGHPGHFEVFNI